MRWPENGTGQKCVHKLSVKKSERKEWDLLDIIGVTWEDNIKMVIGKVIIWRCRQVESFALLGFYVVYIGCLPPTFLYNLLFVQGCLNLKNGTDSLSRNFELATSLRDVKCQKSVDLITRPQKPGLTHVNWMTMCKARSYELDILQRKKEK